MSDLLAAPPEFTIGAFTYKVGRLDVMKQFHLLRRLAPVLNTLREGATDGDLLGRVAGVANAVARMSDADSEFVIGTCLGVVQRREGEGRGWSPIWNAGTGRPMFMDLDMATMLQVAARVLQEALGPFFVALPSLLAAGQMDLATRQ